MYPHRLAGALSLTRALCCTRGVPFLHQLVKDESVFEDAVLNVIMNVKTYVDNDVKTMTRLVSESFSILNALRARVEEDEGEEELWKVVRHNMSLILSTIVEGIESAADDLDSTVRDRICDTAVYFFRNINDDEDMLCDILRAFNRVLVKSTSVMRSSCLMKRIVMPICRLPVIEDNSKQSYSLRRLITMRCTHWMATQMKDKSETFSKVEVVSVVKMLHQFVDTSGDVWTDEIVTLTQTLVHAGAECWSTLWSVRECRECFQCLYARLIEIRKRQGKLKELYVTVSENWQFEEPREWFLKEIESVRGEIVDDV